ncbi:BMP family lipoprotein [Tractidigestivibacter scatoligenes]|jgi:basic membrane protein A|nr:BMP family ABC transporter substrate-binding protein [Tractidigestivibacter scatoligenes]
MSSIDHGLHAVTRRQALKGATGILGLAGVLGVSGCSSSSTDGQSSGSSDGGDEKSYKVAMIMSETLTDRGWGQGHYESLQRAVESHPNWTMLQPRENTASADAANAAQSYVDQDVDLIIGAGNEFASDWKDVIESAADGNPNVHFLLTNTNPMDELADYTTLANVETVLPNFIQIGALAGVIAGLMTNSNSIGFIAGMKLPSSTAKYAAYLAAAQKVNPQVTGMYNFDAGFTDSAFGANLTNQWIASNNVDVMWGDASGVDNGARQALEQAGAETHFDIAQPIDIVGDSEPTVIASTVLDWMIAQVLDEVEAGTFGNGEVITASMDNGGVSLGKFSDKVPADVQEKIEEYEDQISAGTFLTDDEVSAIEQTL